MKTKTRLLVVDSNPLMRSGLRHILQSGAYFDVSEAKDDLTTMAVMDQVEIKLVLLTTTPGNRENDKVLIKKIKNKYPAVKVAVLSAYSDFKLVYDLYAAGANCMLDKGDDGKMLIKHVKLILKGAYSFDESLRKFASRNAQGNYQAGSCKSLLSARQFEIAKLWCEWKSGPQIGAELGIKANTVHSHIQKIYRKTNTHSRFQLQELMRSE